MGFCYPLLQSYRLFTNVQHYITIHFVLFLPFFLHTFWCSIACFCYRLLLTMLISSIAVFGIYRSFYGQLATFYLVVIRAWLN